MNLLIASSIISLIANIAQSTIIVGAFNFGKSNGQGTYTFYDGGKYVGEFFNGKMWNGTKYDENGNFSYKLVNGVEQE